MIQKKNVNTNTNTNTKKKLTNLCENCHAKILDFKKNYCEQCYNVYKMQLSELKNENERINDEKKQISEENEKLQNEKNILVQKLNEKDNELQKMKIQLEITNKQSEQYKKEKDTLTQKISNLEQEREEQKINAEKFEKQFSSRYDLVKAENFYDIIAGIDSIKNIEKGWKIRFSDLGEQLYKKNEGNDCIKIGVVGNGNKGKSFLLNKLSNFDLPASTTIRTEGLSLKYPDLAKEKFKNIILLDSAGTETPLTLTDEEINELNNNKKYQDKIEELAKDKTLTELFLQNIIITTSDLLILVVGILTYSEQKLLNRVKKELKKSNKKTKKLYVIHNLQTFTKIEQVEKYITEQLMHSATFQLKKRNQTLIKNEGNEDSENYYFYEEEVREKDVENDFPIVHLIMANDLSKAGEYYNQFVINFLRYEMSSCTYLKPFDIIEEIKNKFCSISPQILDNIEVNENNIEVIEDKDDTRRINRIIILKCGEQKELVLKKCLVDELGFSNFSGSSYEPKFRYYVKEDKLIIDIEVPGLKEDETKYDISEIGENYQFKFTGIKEIKTETTEKQQYYSNIIVGEFKLVFSLKICDFPLKDKDATEFSYENGIINATFNLNHKNSNAKKIVFTKKKHN